MAGHSKWKNIQHRKNAQDSKRGKIFTKIAIELTVAARIGGGDPADNPRLRAALTKAKLANMPKDNCQRAIKKGTGDGGGEAYAEKTYEGYGPGGAAVLVECLTDNINRTVSEVRFIFSRAGGNLGQDGSVAWIFERKGLFIFDKDAIKDYDSFFELALENGALNVEEEEEYYEVTCEADTFLSLKQAFDEAGLEPEVVEISQIPKNETEMDQEKFDSLEKMIAALEDNDDVQNVYHNGTV